MKLPLRELLLLMAMLLPIFVLSQDCTLDDASGCLCPDGSDKCDLLPNLKVSRDLLDDPGARAEYVGTLRFSVSTPNIGHGPLRVIPTNDYICGKDTLFDNEPIQFCPDGSLPRQLVRQRIYTKEKDSMSFWERDAGFMLFHSEHRHMHFNNWNKYTLRLEDPNEPNPLKWPLIGEEGKLGFCLEDTNNCEFYEGYCRGENDTIFTNDLPNYGLGGGKYDCDASNQGISVGWMDIYFLNVDGMLINLPQGVCNGKYKLIVEVDPDGQIIEENEKDNIEMVDVILNLQKDTLNLTGDVFVSGAGQAIGCDGKGLDLSVPRIGSKYLWSTGDTTHSINVTEAGLYSCVIETPCGRTKTNEALVTKRVCTTDCVDIELNVWLEGPLDTAKLMMTNQMNRLGLLPGQRPLNSVVTPTPKGHPYRVAPWNYGGVEGYDWIDDQYSDEVVDWVLVSFRDSIPKDTEFLQTAALLLEDGEVEFVNSCALPIAESPDSMYILIEHRNHIGIMTAQPIHLKNRKLECDFRKVNSYQGVEGSGNGQKLLRDSVTWVMFAGDGSQLLDGFSYDINGDDKSVWFNGNGTNNVYSLSDYSLNGDVSGLDKIFWNNNNGISSRVPKK